jgi:hypothetical protein
MPRVRDYHDRRTLTRVTAYRISVAAAGLALLGTVGVLPSASASSPRVVVVSPLDHHLCYTARALTKFRIPTGVVLKNQFNPSGFPVRVGPPVLHCNPVEKILPAAKFPIKFPAAHLACFRITAPQQSTQLVLVQNQFGEADLNVGQPLLLCLPSWKRIGGPPHTPTPQPPNLGHFTCYMVTVQQGAYQVPKGIMLQDQFSRRPVNVQVSNVPVLLCLPTVKIVQKHDRSPYINKLHLLCFPVGPTPRKPVVYDKNQFGTAKIAIGRTALLCLPSTKQVIHP